MSNVLLYIKKYYSLLTLMRVNEPIGIFLLLWPTLWGLWLSHQGMPNVNILIIFVLGVLFMRSAGCVMNDYVDCSIDRLVERTKKRPLPTGLITKKDALILLLILFIILALIVLNLNFFTILLSLIALLLSGIYPYLKRYIYFPQLILGILFSFPILMAFTAVNYSINSTTYLVCLINIIWVIVYDTQYAMIDREDDRCIGIKSSAIFFGNMDKYAIGFLQFLILFLLFFLGWKEHFSIVFYVFSVFGVTILFIWQQALIYGRKKINLFQAFLSNNYVGMLIFMGIAFNFY